jgi:AraC family transcriptional regulator of adaptative response/methylated-DNA-[protein]-cysteine methyltransferase
VFYYSVKSTGVYCRPSCGSRQARRENVRFHATCNAAERAGFRACKRCRPKEDAQRDAVAKACVLIESADFPPQLAELAAAAGMSRFHFQRVFKRAMGLTPKAYATAVRARRVREALTTSKSVTAAVVRAGYPSNGRFYAESKSILGMQPAEYRNGANHTTIRYAVSRCSLGLILIAATDRGVCAIFFGDNPQTLVAELGERFPKSELVAGDKKFERLVRQVVRYVEKPEIGLELPLDIRGTAFQERVWQALNKIHVGETITYTELARRIGSPQAVRAVAAACAANHLAVAIPCHRVVRKSGSLAGYRWGIERKRQLIERESRRG